MLIICRDNETAGWRDLLRGRRQVPGRVQGEVHQDHNQGPSPGQGASQGTDWFFWKRLYHLFKRNIFLVSTYLERVRI